MTVRARQRIEQSPLSEVPAVPKGTEGLVSDFDRCAQLFVVDFGAPYGDVLCERSELIAPGNLALDMLLVAC